MLVSVIAVLAVIAAINGHRHFRITREKSVASIVLIAHDHDEIITSDIEDLKPLAAASGRHVELVHP